MIKTGHDYFYYNIKNKIYFSILSLWIHVSYYQLFKRDL